ncbi:MAG: 2OG-Fe(II) oxygenase [Phenylobacterium sp.]|nr:2OG-Fe(II) oxygenase [Phenylobacterium sp.]
MSLLPGQPAPWFIAPTASSPEFVFDSAAGRYVVLLLLPEDPQARSSALNRLVARQPLFDDAFACAFVVLPPSAQVEGARDIRGLRWVFDRSGQITARYGPEPQWILLDPTLRVIATAAASDGGAILRALQDQPPPPAHAGVPMHAPVLVAPRIFEPELCQALVQRHEADGGAFTGVMRDAGDRTVAVMDDLKRRRDIWIEDAELQAALRERLERRLFPFIALALGFQATHIERYLVSCYDAADGGVFRPHRDNTTQGTAHRRFACSLNLNDDFDGGDLRFAEYGLQTYRPPLGGAVVFSCAILHEALPVTRGRRYAFLPFFFDPAGAATRAAYEARVAGMPGAPA